MPPRCRRILTVAAWALILGGLFAMHGLGTHGTATQHGPAMTMAGSVGHSEHAPADMAADAGEHTRTQGSSGDAGDGGGMGLLTVCVVILTAAIAALTLFLLRHQRRRPIFRGPGTVHHTVVAGRGGDPPDLISLSVMRC